MSVASTLTLVVREAYLWVLGDFKEMTVASTLTLTVREACLCVRGELRQMTVASTRVRECQYMRALSLVIQS